MKILVDSVGVADQELANVLTDVLATAKDQASFQILDRGQNLDFGPLEVLPFPSYELDRVNSADSIMLQQYCDLVEADRFMTTGWTTPLVTPGILIGGAGSILGGTIREQQERLLCLKFCHAIVCVSDVEYGPDDIIYRQYNWKVADMISHALFRPSFTPAFYAEWARLRRLQEVVDTQIWSKYSVV